MPKYKIIIDRELCIGDQACCAEAPDTIEMDDENIASVKDPEGNTPEQILAAARICPVDAITLIELTTGEQAWPD